MYPHDTPTHLLENPQQYTTRVGRILRKTSLDELPQIFQIFTGKMAVIGPRPALWNQYDLIAQRDLYGANDVRPGLTGWAQINGRDELPIDVKARLDGEYVKKMSFLFDCKCFFGSITAVLKHEGVVEGGTGTMGKEQQKRSVYSLSAATATWVPPWHPIFPNGRKNTMQSPSASGTKLGKTFPFRALTPFITPPPWSIRNRPSLTRPRKRPICKSTPNFLWKWPKRQKKPVFPSLFFFPPWRSTV